MTVEAVLAALQVTKRSGNSCVAENGFCPSWIADNLDRYVTPFWQHVYLTLIAVGVGFAIAGALAIVAHRRRWLVAPIAGFTSALYTIPSVAAFFLLQPLTGRGNFTAEIALVSYTLLIIFRNITTGLNNVPPDAIDAGRGMGLTENQLLWRVEVPLAVPEILAGLRIAFASTVGLVALAFFAGGGGLGQLLSDGTALRFKSNVVVAGGLAIGLAAVLDLLVLGFQRLVTPWQRAVAS